MCYFCIEYQKEKLNAEEVSKLFSELLVSGDRKHLDEFEQIGDNLSQQYKEKLNEEANELFNDFYIDPFDPF